MTHKHGIGECKRCGQVFPVKDLVKDGHSRGLLVCRACYDPRHPQERPPVFGGERHSTPSPEISKPDGEGTAAPAFTFDELGRLI